MDVAQMNVGAAAILASLLIVRAVEVAAAILNLWALRPELPPEMQGIYDRAAYERSQEYTRATTLTGLVKQGVDLAALCVFWFAGGFQSLDELAREWGGGPVLSGLLFLGALLLLSALLSLPFSVHATFVVEERFGFNRTTPGTFVLDRVKALALATVLGGPLLAAVLAIFAHAGRAAWLACWAAVAGYTLVVQFVAPTWIMPLFNTFTPLGKGELRERIERYAASVRFSLENIFLMDGSRRSSRSNAFFTGFGKHRRIALFDTLVARLTAGELVAVLAHEIGHYRRRHVLKGTALSIAHTGVMLWIFSLLTGRQWLYDAFFVEVPSVHTGLALFGILLAPVEAVVAAARNAWSRRNEYEADRFAAETTAEPEELVGALKKLSIQNLANLTPHPWHVALHYSHPPLLERIAGIRAVRAPRLRSLPAWPVGISRRAVIMAVAVALAGFLALSEQVHGQILAALALADPLFALHPVLGAVLFVGLAALSAVFVFFSGVLLVPVGVQTWGHVGCFLLLWSGWVLGGLVTFSVGRRFGRPFVRRLLPAGAVARYESLIPAGGSFLTATLVQLALPSDVSGYFFGLSGYRARVYLGALVFAELPYALGAVYLGTAFIHRQYWLLLAAAAVGAALFAWGRRRRRSRAALR